ncbi:hypothetical protein FKW77_001462 [Venturia effusa]|uniref:Zn(2)-C6 fungal-type domain-containing protein n=1 Tax=Venturia effusa TaxID=50376 RepID=A0A517L8M9_9PEZI|nr:hypothetical protein FKW77_001462 [Venturia effusa]
MSSDAEDASSDPNFNGEHDDLDNMADSPKGDVLAQKTESNASASSDQQNTTHGQKPNPKDPLRPRRKKARRACFACQRAHLTCGDERPCQRCIKRGLQEACHDGVRKKAKYLHDAPPEALVPPGMGGYHHPYINGNKASPVSSTSGLPMTGSSTAHTQIQSQYVQAQSPNLDMYAQNTQSHMPPPLQAHANASITFTQPPASPGYVQAQEQLTPTMAQSVPTAPQSMNQYGAGLAFDPSDPALFNFDIASLNFGNQYGAMEFGMLNHMSSTANDGNQTQNEMHHMNQIPAYSLNYSDNSMMFSQDALMNVDWQNNHPRADSTSGLLSTPNNTPIATTIDRPNSLDNLTNAYAIGNGPSSFASASPATSAAGYDGPSADNPPSPALFAAPQTPAPSASPLLSRSKAQPVQPPDLYPQETGKRKRPSDADELYHSVNKPYGYTAGFHRLFKFISQRFSSEKRLRIAKAVSAVRPSLITFSQSLTDKDLVFMELSVQRKLHEYIDFINAYGTPTVITRRDGAILAASKEFTILTGWSKNVLTGKEPNLNVNSGGASGPSTMPSSASRTRLSSAEEDRNVNQPSSGDLRNNTATSQPQPALMAEILDQDSVVQFYEDYAKLAFGDPRGYGIRRGKLLKYKTKEDSEGPDVGAGQKRKRSASIKGEPGVKLEEGRISGESGINQLGQKEGMVDVMYCWNVRRDVFEVPMLIVMNFLPLI